ncbi:hypothetical protein [Streptomyces sedi]|uniref:Guanylate cyclase domain-containing protein n=1 Tax=Streptomyces sedi TaxID=555059 RepID=A0A5C4V4B9_9ACTN|nr:hypothetical protein [Streptomyces sedi]TNM30316.1 hypothetical protein FH715_13305 [Streptomyces sedi]
MDAKIAQRKALYRAFDEAFEVVGVLPGESRHEDRGDGVLATVEPTFPAADMVGVWVDTLHQGVRAHNRAGGVPLRLRVAMHAGPVTFDARGLVGRAVDLACRLCDSEAARRAIDGARADLLLVVSDTLYRTVVREGGRYIEPERYARLRVGNKETDEYAWFLLPGRPPPRPGPDPVDTGDDAPARAANAPRPRPVFHVRGDNQVIQDNVFHGPFTGIHRPTDSHGSDGSDEGGRFHG